MPTANDPEHADIKDRAGEEFDPDEFDLAGINESLPRLQKWSEFSAMTAACIR